MPEINDADELERELRRLLAYSRTEQPSRAKIASALEDLAGRLAGKQAGFGRSPEEWALWLDKTVSIQGQELAANLGHFLREATRPSSPTSRGAISEQAEDIARKARKLAVELDENIGRLLIQLGNDSFESR
jgi:hypothetical protein